MTREQVQLTLRIIQQHFGGVPSEVATVIISRNGCTLAELVRSFTPPIDYWKIRNSVITLIQHNAVYPVFEQNEASLQQLDKPSKTPPGIVRYFIDERQVLGRLRYSKFAIMIEQVYGINARLIAFQLLKMGRASMTDIVSCALHDQNSSITLSTEEDENPSHDIFVELSGKSSRNSVSSSTSENRRLISKDDFDLVFVKLVVANVFKRVEPFVVPNESSNATESTGVHQSAQSQANSKTAAGRSKKTTSSPAKAKPVAKRTRKGSTSQQSDLPKDMEMMLYGDNYSGGTSSGKRSKGVHQNNNVKPHVEEKKKLRVLIDDFINRRVVFMVNTDFLTLELYKKTVEELLAVRFGQSNIVRMCVKALITKVRYIGSNVVGGSMTFSEVEAFADEEMNRSSGDSGEGLKIASNNLLLIIEGLARHEDGIVRSVQQEDRTRAYAIDWQQAKTVIRRRICFTAVATQFGDICARIWSYITHPDNLQGIENKCWDDQHLAEPILAAPHEVRSSLFNLCRKGLCRTHVSDAAPGNPASSSTTSATRVRSLVFSSNLQMSCDQIRLCLYETALRLWARKQDINISIYKLYLRVQTLTDVENRDLHAKERGEDLLEVAYLKLDNSLLLMTDI